MEGSLIEAVKTGDFAAVENLLSGGADANQSDEQGWTPLNFGAGRGDLAIVKLLVKYGADLFKTGRDNRTPYMIALAAGHAQVVKYLGEAEIESDSAKARSLRPQRQYCKAYPLGELRKFGDWFESRVNLNEKDDQKEKAQAGDGTLTDEKIVFIHQDFTVTESMWQNENVIFNRVSEAWREFCSRVLGFRVPTDLDLIVTNQDPEKGSAGDIA
jgi:uncharacterized protein